MIIRSLFGLIFSLCLAQDTFSIVAVNPFTGEVGSAGASCIAGSIIISDVHPGIGAVHTQSYWIAENQNLGNEYMNQGYSPEQIIDSLVSNDIQNNPEVRQYGVVDLIDGGRSAAFTGENCFDYKGHIISPTYSIQGNILLGEEILSQMEYNFLNTQGNFSQKLMSALQGAKVSGADTRCEQYGTSSLSAFIRLAHPNDNTEELFLDININNVTPGTEPIDLLQNQFDSWQATQPNILLGDVNSDSFINITDILLMVSNITSNYPLSIQALYSADTNNDSTLNIQDIIIVINIILGN